MITEITGLPENAAGFRATGEVTKDDCKNVIVPNLSGFAKSRGKINLLLCPDTDVENFTLGTGMHDALLGLKHIPKWNRAAIVSDSEGAIKFTDAFSFAVHGKFKGFRKSEYHAVQFVSKQINPD